MAKIKKILIRPLNLPLRNPFRTALGEKTVTKNILVTLDCGGFRGYGEASSSLAMPEATQESMGKILNECAKKISGSSIENWEEICENLVKKYPKHPTAISAMECALLDAFCKHKKMSLARFFGGKSVRLETDYTLPALGPKETLRIAQGLIKKKFSKFKIKITGKNFEEDLARIESIFRSAERSVLIDANQGLTEKQSVRLLRFIFDHKIGVDLIEQPFPKHDIKSLIKMRKKSAYMIAVDESLRTFSDAKRIIEADAADVFNIKIARMGLLQGLRTAQYVWSLGKKLMIGCMMESAIGLSTAVQWASGSGQFSFIDLDSFLLLKSLPYKSGFASRGPFLTVKKGVLGSGVGNL